jgi:hypothetical protein
MAKRYEQLPNAHQNFILQQKLFLLAPLPMAEP